MNKTEFIKAIADKADISLSDATAAVNAYTAVLTEALKAGDKITLGGFGTYEVKEKPERQGCNPITKQPVTVAASRVPNLKFGKAFKELF